MTISSWQQRAAGLVMLLTVCGAGWWTASAAAQSAEPFAVEGQVVNGTAGGAVPVGLPVRIVAFTDDRTLGSWEGATGDQGRYRVEGVTRGPGATYVVGTDYAGVPYVDRFEPGSEGTVPVPALSVYESVAEDPGIRFERSAWIVSEVDAPSQTISMLEVHGLANPTDRTFLPRSDGPGGPAGLLVFALPAHAFGLTPRLGLDPSAVIQIDRGFAAMAPVRPGRTEMAFSYQFPYSEASYPLRRTLRYPVESLRVLAPTDGPQLTGEGFQVLDGALVGDRQFRELRSGLLGPGAVVNVNLEGLPIRPGLAVPVQPGVVAIAGALIGMSTVLAAWWRNRGAGRLTPPSL